MLYLMNEVRQMLIEPVRMAVETTRQLCENPFHPLAYTPNNRVVAAGCEMFERATRSYPKPAFDVGLPERVVWESPFCRVLAFGAAPGKPKLLIVAPMSGHHATLLRGTVQTFVETHQVMITDWVDARLIPVSVGRFGLSDYVDHCIAMFRDLGPDLNVLAVCQPSVPVLAAIARMEEENDPDVPSTATLIGGPIDTRHSPTAVNTLAQERGIDWFRRHCIQSVPWNHPGRGRRVYPGFMQLSGFIGMNWERHAGSHWNLFDHLVQGDEAAAQKQRAFYDEYLAVMDLTEEFYLETVESVFIDHDLPRGRMLHHGHTVDLGAIRRCALMAVEGEKDDITGIGQTRAALDLTPNLADERKAYHLQPGAGHYGIFNGSRFRAEIVPRIATFIDGAATGVSEAGRATAHAAFGPHEPRSIRSRAGHTGDHHWHVPSHRDLRHGGRNGHDTRHEPRHDIRHEVRHGETRHGAVESVRLPG